MRYAEVAIEFENRRPVEIVRMQYFILPLNSKGQIDTIEQDNSRKLVATMYPPLHFERDPVVIDAQHHFAKKRFDNQYRWKPTPEIEMAILKAIFKTNL